MRTTYFGKRKQKLWEDPLVLVEICRSCKRVWQNLKYGSGASEHSCDRCQAPREIFWAGLAGGISSSGESAEYSQSVYREWNVQLDAAYLYTKGVPYRPKTVTEIA